MSKKEKNKGKTTQVKCDIIDKNNFNIMYQKMYWKKTHSD